MQLGIEVLVEQRFRPLDGARVGLIVNAASLNSRLEHSVDIFRREPRANLTCLFGPQHGVWGNTQDNMVEWESFTDRQTGLPVYSLYGKTRKPLPEMLESVDALVFDVQDVGARIYTFVYTMALGMQAAAEAGKRFVVLDRPNPISGAQVEGNVLEPGYESFVGMYPIPMRHGMTIGELALMFNHAFGVDCALEVINMNGWSRQWYFDQTGAPWVMPSPNIPTLDTSIVYPGTVLLEGTNLSEGRGTTRPFEILGAPYIDPQQLADRLAQDHLPGAVFRPLFFTPTFQKYAGELCGGVQIHVVDRTAFMPVITAVAIISAIRALYPDEFGWRKPPYEYVTDRLPFDVIAGTDKLRTAIESLVPWRQIEMDWSGPLALFCGQRRPYLLYQ